MRRATFLLVALLATAAAGCGPAEPVARHDDTIVVASGAATVTDYDDYIAREKGFYKQHHVKTEYLTTQTAAQATQLLATGEADIGRGIADAIQANVATDRKLDYISVADMLTRPPHVLMTDGTKSFDDIKGRKIGISSPTDNTTIVTEGLLEGKNIDPARANLIPAGGTSSRLAAMQSGGVTATLLLPPANFKAVKEAGLTSLGSVPQLLGPDWGYSFTSVIVDRRWATLNRDLLVRFLQARDDALRWLADPRNRKEAIAILEKYTEAKPSPAAKTYDLISDPKLRAFAPRIGINRKADANVLRVMETAGHLKERGLDASRFTDDSYAAEARRRNGGGGE
jgi:NitT/TauT family transport system substrate-binding protein